MPPNPKDNETAIDSFSAERAFQHIRHIAKHPHPTGSYENYLVREYILQELEKLELYTIVDTFSGDLSTKYFNGDIELNNIIGILKGTEDGKALMLSAHYDSVPNGSGANDNGASVAALLETARALKNSDKLKNDVWFVFTDGEELGLLGAEIFWKKDSYRNAIGLVINFESRGSKGPSMMYQTSDHNGTLIQEFSKVAPKPLANSFMGDIYKKMPNDTDLTISLDAGIPGLNFAYIDGWEYYHTPYDNIDNVDKSSLQHQGENALSMAKHFGNLNLENLESPNEIYFSLLGKMIHFPQSYVIPLSILLTLFIITIFSTSINRGIITYKGVLLSTLKILIIILTSLITSISLWIVINNIWVKKMTLSTDATYDSILYNTSFVLVTFLMSCIVSNHFRKTNEFENMFAGTLLFLTALIGTVIYLPGASYLFLIPLLINGMVLSIAIRCSNPFKVINSLLTMLIISFFPIVLFTTVYKLLFIGLPPYLNIGLTILTSILLSFLEPIYKLFNRNKKLQISLLSTIIIILLVTGWVNSHKLDRPVYIEDNEHLHF
jgi:Peptidase family M28